MHTQQKLTDIMGIQYPIIQAPMAGGATTPELVAAVSNAGGLGSFAAGYLAAADIKKSIKKIRELTKKPFAVNLFIPEKHHAASDKIITMCSIIESCCSELNIKIEPHRPPYAPSFEEQMQVIIDEKIPVFSFTFGVLNDFWISKLKSNNTLLTGTATNLEEAKLLEKSGVDFIAAQGCEAGGHRGTFIGKAEDSLIGLMSLIPQLTQAVKIPIIAAGGIMDARGIAAAMLLGASGVQIGTAFLTCSESGIHSKYKEALLNTSQDNTLLTRAFSGKLARGVKNEFIARMEEHNEKILDYPIQNALTRGMRKEAEKQNKTDFMSMFAGQSACLCRAHSAAELIKKWVRELTDIYDSNSDSEKKAQGIAPDPA